MAERDTFEETCAAVCEENAWSRGGAGIEVGLEEGRHQKVSHERFDFEGEQRVRLSTTIGDATRIDPLRLAAGLRLNCGLPYGFLAVRGDDLVMVDTLSVRAEAAELRAAIRYLAEMADHFERTMFGPDAH